LPQRRRRRFGSRPELIVLLGRDIVFLVERLRALPEGRELPIVVWTVKDLDPGERRRLESSRAEIVSKRGDGARALLEAMHRLLPLATVQAEHVHGR